MGTVLALKIQNLAVAMMLHLHAELALQEFEEFFLLTPGEPFYNIEDFLCAKSALFLLFLHSPLIELCNLFALPHFQKNSTPWIYTSDIHRLASDTELGKWVAIIQRDPISRLSL